MPASAANVSERRPHAPPSAQAGPPRSAAPGTGLADWVIPDSVDRSANLESAGHGAHITVLQTSAGGSISARLRCAISGATRHVRQRPAEKIPRPSSASTRARRMRTIE